MDFFAHQEAALARSRRLLVLFVLAVALIVAAVNVAAVFIYIATGGIFWDMASGPLNSVGVFPPRFFLLTSLATLAVIGGGTWWRLRELREGGRAVARLMGGRQVAPAAAENLERRLLNVVEEMAIASGVSVPAVYVLDFEPGINAFAAGYSPNQAVIAVTRGALERLSRDELQGVIAHEFSHILNGDMRLNTRLIGLVHGILLLALTGQKLIDITPRQRGGRGSLLLLLGITLVVIGYVGVFFARLIKAGVSRQREFLADASAVQFTRNPDGIGQALRKIAGDVQGARLHSAEAETLSHMCFGDALPERFFSWLATHPPLEERLERIYGTTWHFSRPAVSAVEELAGASGFAGPQRRAEDAADGALAIDRAALTEQVGRPDAAHRAYAGELLQRLPAPLQEAARRPEGARAAVYVLLLAREGRVLDAQRGILETAGENARQVVDLARQADPLAPELRLPLVELAMPALLALAADTRAAFLRTVKALIAADARITLEEFVLDVILEKQLGPQAGQEAPIAYRSLAPLVDDARLLLSLLAHAGQNADAARAYALGAGELGIGDRPLIGRKELKLPAVAAAMDRLGRAAPKVKRLTVEAALRVTLADGTLRRTEGELLRAVAAALDCPLPPLAAGSAAGVPDGRAAAASATPA